MECALITVLDEINTQIQNNMKPLSPIFQPTHWTSPQTNIFFSLLLPKKKPNLIRFDLKIVQQRHTDVQIKDNFIDSFHLLIISLYTAQSQAINHL